MISKPDRIEVFDFKNAKSLAKFKVLTTETNQFTDCFENLLPLSEQMEKWEHLVDSYSNKAFKKIRVKKKCSKPMNPKLKTFINQRNTMLQTESNKEKLEQIEISIADEEAKEIYEKIAKQFKEFSDDPEKINRNKMWKSFKQLWPKNNGSVPVAKKDHTGNIVSSQKDIKNLLLREYTNRLRSRPVREDLKSLKSRRTKIFEMKLSLAGDEISSDWTMKDLEKVLESLKNNKSRDPKGFVNELFKIENIGDNLKASLLLMMNRIKKTSIVPEIMRYANITTIPKKGSRLELKNERGIFRCSVLRQILMRLIYDSKYEIIDKNMSEFQMGARKNKGCRNTYLSSMVLFKKSSEVRNINLSCSKYTTLLRCLMQLT